jgi:hypothetical protein
MPVAGVTILLLSTCRPVLGDAMPRTLHAIPALLLLLVPMGACHRHHHGAPTANDQSFNVNENGAISGTLSISDPNWDSLSFNVTTSPQNGNLAYDSNNGTFNYQPAHNYSGSDSFQWQAQDDEGFSNIATVSFTVVPTATTMRQTVPAGPRLAILEGASAPAAH